MKTTASTGTYNRQTSIKQQTRYKSLDTTRSEAFLIDLTHRKDHNLRKAESTELTKYYDLAEEYEAINQLNTVTVVPIVISCNGKMGKKLEGNRKKIEVSNKLITLLQKSVII